MLAYLKGKIIDKQEGQLIILVNDLGYQVFTTKQLAQEKNIGEEIELYLHQHIKEDELSLFGFQTKEELELFKLLLSVSGIGPKSGLNVLVIASVPEIKQAIVYNDSSLLTKVSGIGQKTAERIVLELKNKVGGLVDGEENNLEASGDEIDALLQLGYSLSQARQALQNIDSDIKDSSERVKQALKYLQ